LSLGFVIYEIYLILAGRIPQTQIASGEALAHGPFLWLAVLPGLWFLAEVTTMFANDKRRALHDLIAGTVVVRTNIEPTSVGGNPSPQDPPGAVA
jgi:hypothetical protein